MNGKVDIKNSINIILYCLISVIIILCLLIYCLFHHQITRTMPFKTVILYWLIHTPVEQSISIRSIYQWTCIHTLQKILRWACAVDSRRIVTNYITKTLLGPKSHYISFMIKHIGSRTMVQFSTDFIQRIFEWLQGYWCRYTHCERAAVCISFFNRWHALCNPKYVEADMFSMSITIWKARVLTNTSSDMRDGILYLFTTCIITT